MSTEIDQRVVEMKFNNSHFERNISTSMKTLKKFKESLNFKGATKGMEELNNEARKFSLAPLMNAVEGVEAQFSTMSIVAISAINRIVSRATDAGIQLVKSLSVDNIAAGWEKFSEKTTSVGTLVAQGYNMDTVEKQLKRLSWFSDETSYNFTDMVSNIAKFTATGKDLESSVTAIEGIANWAALSGQNAGIASRAMYQISQAMGAGTMRKEDWKSIQNVSMDTDEFRQKALDAAVAIGTLKKTEDGLYKSTVANTKAFDKTQFAEHLTQDAWFTSDVMMKVFQDYSSVVDQIMTYAEENEITASQAIQELEKAAKDGEIELDAFAIKAFKAAQEARTWADVIGSVKDAVSSGWMNTFELIFGNYEEAKTLFTDLANGLYDVFAEGGNRRNDVLGEGLLSTWRQFVNEGIPDANAFKDKVIEIAKAVGAIDEEKAAAIRDDFEGSLTDGWLTDGVLHDAIFEVTQDIRLFSKEQLKEKGYTDSQISSLTKLNEQLMTGELNVRELTELMSQSSGRSNLVEAFWNLYNALFAVDEETGKAKGIISAFKEAVAEIFPPITGDQVYSITERIKAFTERLIPTEETLDKLKSIFRGLASVVDIFKQVLDAVWRSLGPVFGLMKTGATTVFDLAANVGDTITQFAASAKQSDLFYNSLQRVIGVAKKVIKPIKDIAVAILEFLGIKSKDDNGLFSGLNDTVEKTTGLFGKFKQAADKVVDVIKNVADKIKDGVSNITISLAKPLDIIRNLWDIISLLLNGLFNAIGKTLELVKELFSSLNPMEFKDLINTIIAGLAAINIKWLTDTVTSLTDVLWTLQNNIKADSLLKIAESVGILALSIVALSLIDSDKLIGSMTAIGLMVQGLFTAVSSFASLFSSLKIIDTAKLIFAMGGIQKLAISFAIVAVALLVVGQLDWNGIAKGLTAMMGTMLIFVTVCQTLSELGKKLTAVQKGMAAIIPMAVGLLLISFAMAKIAKLSWEGIGKGLLSFAGVMLIFTTVCQTLAETNGKMANATKTLSKMIPFSISLLLVSAALKSIGKMEWEAIAKGLVGISGVMIIMTIVMGMIADLSGNTKVAIKALTSMIPLAISMVILGAAMHLIASLRWEEITKGLVAFGGAMLAMVLAINLLTQAGVGGGQAAGFAASILLLSSAMLILSAALKVISSIPTSALIGSLLGLSVALAAFIGAAIIAQNTGVIGAIVALGGAMALIGVGALAAGAGLALVATAIATLVAIGPAALSLVSDLLLFAPMLGEAMATAFTSFLKSLVTMLPVLGELIGKLVEFIGQVLVEHLPKLIVDLFTSLIKIIKESGPKLIEAVTDLLTMLLDGIVNLIPVIMKSVEKIIIGVLEGIRDALPNIAMAGVQIIMALLQGIADAQIYIVEKAYDIAISFINGLADTIREKKPLLKEAIKNLMDAIFGDIKERVVEWKEAAKDLVSGFIQGIKDKVSEAIQAVKDFGGSIVDKFKEVFKIQSPSKVMRDEVGRYIVQGVAEGIKNDMSAEEAAAKKAQNITNAFKNSLAIHDAEIKHLQIDLDTTRLENPFLSNEEIKDLELDKLNKEIEIARKRFEKEAAKFKTAEQTFEEGSLELLEATNNYDQAWIDYLKTEKAYQNAAASRDEIGLIFKDTGEVLISGFLNGITADMSMEDAAKKKAENILTAFEKTLSKIDTKTSIADLRKSIWEIANPEYNEHAVGFNETEQENSTKQMVSKILKNQQDIEAQAEKVKIARAQYQAIVKATGENSDAAKKALETQLNEEKSLMQLAAEQQDLKQYKPSYSRAMELIEGMSEDDRMNWFTTIAATNPIQQIFDAAIEAAGTIPDTILDNMDEWFAPLMDENTYNGIVNGIEVVFKEDIPQVISGSLGTIGATSKEVAKETGEVTADAFLLAFDNQITKRISGAANQAEAELFKNLGWNKLNSALQDHIIDADTRDRLAGQMTQLFHNLWDDQAKDAADGGTKIASLFNTGFVNTLVSGRPDLYKNVSDVFSVVPTGSADALDEHSPSKIAEQQGEYYIIGFCNGLLNKIRELKSTSSIVGKEAQQAMEGIVTKIDQVLQGDLDFTPSISPVLDLSDVYATASRLGGLLDTSGTYTMANDAYSDAEEARMAHKDYMTQVLIDSIGRKLDSLGYSLDDLREVVEQLGGDIDIDVNVDGASLARATVNDYISASRANGTPFYTEIDV